MTADSMPSLPSNAEFIYGTAWKEDETSRLTTLALESGFRAIDTANQRKHYHEAGVGEALSGSIEDGFLDRSDVFLQTKFTYASGQDHRLPYDPDASFQTQVTQSLESSLEHLKTDYVDSFILHGPYARSGLTDPDREVWRAMEELVRTPEVGQIGVSNVSPNQLEKLVDFAEEPISYVQNRCFARTGWDRPVRQVCEPNGIRYQGFSLLTANQRNLQSETFREIADRRNKTIQQIVFRFALDIGIWPLTGTTSQTHMKQDLACTEFELTDDEVQRIETISE